MAEQDYATVGGVKVHRADFAYAPAGSNPSDWKLPIHDEGHVRNALARFNQTELPAAAQAAAKAKILARAHKYGIDTSGFEEKHASEVSNLKSQIADPGERAAMHKLLGIPELSHDRIRDLLNAKLESYFPQQDTGPFARIEEVYPGYAIIEHQGKQYRMDYEVSGDEVKTKRPVEVTVEKKLIPTSELGAARAALMSEVEKYRKGHDNCPLAIALEEVSRLKPELWKRYSGAVMRMA